MDKSVRRTRSMVSGRSSGSSSMPSRRNATLPRPQDPAPAPPVTPVPMPVMRALPPVQPVQPMQAVQPMQPVQQSPPIPAKRYILNNDKKQQKGREITKADIGKPQDFRHISHVGWDYNKGFHLDDAPEADVLRSFFTKAKVSEKQLQDQETREFICDFIEVNGGLPAIKQDLDNGHRSFEPDTRARSKMPVTRSTGRRGGPASTTPAKTNSTDYANATAIAMTAVVETVTTSGAPTVAATNKSDIDRRSKPTSSRPSKRQSKALRLARARTELAAARLAEIEAESSDEVELKVSSSSFRPSKRESKALRLARARTELTAARLAEIEAESSDEDELALVVNNTKSLKRNKSLP